MNLMMNKTEREALAVLKSDNILGVKAYLCSIEISSTFGYTNLGTFDVLRPNRLFRELKAIPGVEKVGITFVRDVRGSTRGRRFI